MDLDEAINCFVSRYQNPSTRKEALWALKTWGEHPEPNPVWKPATVHVLNTFVRSFCRWAKGQGLEVPGPPTGRLTCPPAVLRDIPDADAKMLLAAIDNERPAWRTFFTLLLETGMRCREGIRLKACDISWRPGEEYILVRSAKGGHGRSVPILSKMRSIDLLRQIAAEVSLEAYVFPGLVRGRPLTASAARYRFRSVCRKAGLMDDEDRPCYQIHQLRHTVAVRWLDAGVNARAVQHILGASGRKTGCQPAMDDKLARDSLEQHAQELYP